VFEVLYHFLVNGTEITIRTSCPKDDPSVESIINIFPGAVLYEREIHDILGIVPNGHPDLRRLVLPEDWVGGYPLRKDWKPPEGKE
jgi:NADH-quinone oxidoreductase subunit C